MEGVLLDKSLLKAKINSSIGTLYTHCFYSLIDRHLTAISPDVSDDAVEDEACLARNIEVLGKSFTKLFRNENILYRYKRA